MMVSYDQTFWENQEKDLSQHRGTVERTNRRMFDGARQDDKWANIFAKSGAV